MRIKDRFEGKTHFVLAKPENLTTLKVWHDAVTPSLREPRAGSGKLTPQALYQQYVSAVPRETDTFSFPFSPYTYATYIYACCGFCHCGGPVQLELFPHVYFTPFLRTATLV